MTNLLPHQQLLFQFFFQKNINKFQEDRKTDKLDFDIYGAVRYGTSTVLYDLFFYQKYYQVNNIFFARLAQE